MAGYTKLFSSIVTSTIWCEDLPTRIVWVAMLAMSDAHGRVEGSVPGFARVANVTMEEMGRALSVLMAPDPHSRTPDNDGRRIEAIPGGWRILNYRAYRDARDPEARREQNRAAQAAWRAKSKPSKPTSASVSQESAQAEAEAEAKAVQRTPPSPESGEGTGAAEAGEVLDTGSENGVTPCPPSAAEEAQAPQGEPKDTGAAPEIPRNAGKGGPVRLARFSPPTPQEAEAYAATLGYKLDGERFVAHYQARGWKFKTGSPVVDWKACVVTWKKRDAQGGPHGSTAAPKRITGTAGYQPGKYADL